MVRPVALAAVLALGAASAPAAPARAAAVAPPAPPGAPAVDWRLEEAGREPLTLDLTAFGSSGCLTGNLAASVTESARQVVVTVVSTATAPICTADYAPHPLTVALRRPLAGRAVVGPRHLRRDATVGDPLKRTVRVPRTTGLSRRDAVDVVHQRGLRIRVVRVADLRGLPRVVGQRPASGRTVSRRATVSVYVSR
jgi:hypothetical protein